MTPPTSELRAHLEELYARTDGRARRAADPVAFVHRYSDPRDQELAGLIAVSLAYGRVDLFFPVLHALFDHLDASGGPAAAVATAHVERDAAIAHLVYRWNRGTDFVVLWAALRRVLEHHGTLEQAFGSGNTTRERLAAGVREIRQATEVVSGVPFAEQPRGLRYLLPSPDGGSACKRWNLFLRWMVRPPREGVDLGIWTTWSPAGLVMPLDVHVHRVSRFLGLTTRNDTSWRTAEAITDALRRLDPEDPVRFDFALAHLGISGDCRGHHDPEVCASCPLEPVCTALSPRGAGRSGLRGRGSSSGQG